MILACILLTSCSSRKENEEEAVVRVAAHSEEYKNAFVELYAQVYPETEIIVDVVSEEDIEKMITDQSMDYEVYWVEDAYVPLIMDHILELNDDTEVPLNKNYIGVFDLVKEAYQPLMAKSDIYYALDLDKIEDTTSLDTFNKFEDVFQLENGFYYYDDPMFTNHFLTSNMNYFPGNEISKLNFTSDSFKESLTNYRKILDTIVCDDVSNYDNWFINNTYYSGFVNTNMQMDADEEINGGKYQITKLPTIENRQLYMQANGYGYVVNKDTKYPNASKNLVYLMHTKQAVQLLCNSDTFIPLIPEEMLDEFTFENMHSKEKAYALDYAVARNFVGISSRNDSAINYLYEESTIEKMRTCDLENIEACQKEFDESYQEWLK